MSDPILEPEHTSAGTTTAPMPMSLPPAELLTLLPTSLSFPLISSSLSSEPASVIGATCLALLGNINDPSFAEQVIDLGLSALQSELDRVEGSLTALLDRPLEQLERPEVQEAVPKLGEDDLQVLRPGKELEERKRRKETWEKIWPGQVKKIWSSSKQAEGTVEEDPSVDKTAANQGDQDGDIDLNDPWAEAEDDTDDARAKTEHQEETVEVDDPWAEAESASSRPSTSRSAKPLSLQSPSAPPAGSSGDTSDTDEPSIDLSTFLSQPLHTSALNLASLGDIRAIQILKDRHPVLWPCRLPILEAFPAWASAADLKSADLLPAASADGAEQAWPSFPPAHRLLCLVNDSTSLAKGLDIRQNPLSTKELTEWYTARVNALDEYHQLDAQLAWVQHAASLGVGGMDRIGEDLSLLSRLVYDSHLSVKDQNKWTLSYWQTASDSEIISAYLSNTTPSLIAKDLRRLVLPYLYVLESRAERSGLPDTQLVERTLHSRMLSLPLPLALSVFEASKATLPSAQRIVRDDLSVARLALAILYGSNEMGDWKTMSSIFECLPVWDVSGGDARADREATNDTLDAIATFVRHAIASLAPPEAEDLYLFFHPLPFTSLSRALDILDVHLESGEILARWSTPVQLRFLLQSARDQGEQRELATKLVDAQRGREGTAWERLWEDMKRLGGGDEAAAKGAFGMLDRDEMAEVWLGGILRSGEFGTAKRMLRRLETEGGLDQSTFERAVLQVSQEFYDKASTGNIHTGDMKLAFDCLSVAPPSPAIRKEKSFIEATSRLSTYSLSATSPAGQIVPREIRQNPNKLSLIALVLESSADAFRHPEIILDVASKLGCGSIEDQVRIRAMLISSCVKAGEYETGYRHMGDMLADLKRLKQPAVGDDKVGTVANTVVWSACLQLGKVEGLDVLKRLESLGRAVEFCPPSEIGTVLSTWRRVEEHRAELTAATKRRRLSQSSHPHAPAHTQAYAHAHALSGLSLSPLSAASATFTNTAAALPSSASAGLARLSETVHSVEDRVLGSRTAARAAKMAMDLGGRWRPASLGQRLRDMSTERSSSRASGRSFSNASALSGTSGDGVERGDGLSPASSGAGAEAGDGWGFASLSRSLSRASDSGADHTGDRGQEHKGYGDLLGGLGISEDERMRDVGRRAFVKGVGWLLGADESEMK